MVENICVAGAGTMGSGIALSAAQNGYKVILFDTNEQVLTNATISINKNLDSLIDKNKISLEEKAFILKNISFSSIIAECKASLIIEAIIEKADAKITLFNQLASINSDQTIF